MGLLVLTMETGSSLANAADPLLVVFYCDERNVCASIF